MKKAIAVLIFVLTLLMLVSCGKSSSELSKKTTPASSNTVVYPGLEKASQEEQEAFAAADLLIQEGKYDEAIEALKKIGIYDAIEKKISEARVMKIQASAMPFPGSWFDVSNISSAGPEQLIVLEDYEVTWIHSTGSKQSYVYSVYDDIVVFYGSNGTERYRFTFEMIDGIQHLKVVDNNRRYDFVPADYYESLKPVSIELTPENWQEYFELQPFETYSINGWGEKTNEQKGYRFYLKGEYLDSFVYDGNSDYEQSIIFYLKDINDKNNYGHLYAVIYDYRDFRNNDYSSGVYGMIVQQGMSDIPVNISPEVIDNLYVVNITGNLNLLP